MTIIWTSDLCTGIDVIDNQHRRIVDYINTLEQAIATTNRQQVGQVLEEVVDYTLSHFSFEESLLEEAGYKQAEPHKAVHKTFVKRLAKYQERHEHGEDVADQLRSMLSTWLIHHIKREDMAYVAEVTGKINGIVRDQEEGSWLQRSLRQFFK